MVDFQMYLERGSCVAFLPNCLGNSTAFGKFAWSFLEHGNLLVHTRVAGGWPKPDLGYRVESNIRNYSASAVGDPVHESATNAAVSSNPPHVQLYTLRCGDDCIGLLLLPLKKLGKREEE